MTGATWAMGNPWQQLGRELDECLTQMSGRHGSHHHRGNHFGMFGGPAGFGPPWGPAGPRGPWRAPKARRGDIRAAILSVLAEQDTNGYQIIQEIAEKSGGVWKPSPGSIYPTLQQLEDEGLVQADRATGRRTFSLTEEGRTYVEEHAEEIAAPWQAMNAAADEGDDAGLKPLLGQVAAAMWQVLAVGSPDQQARAREALAELRRTLYAILAEDEQDDGGDS